MYLVVLADSLPGFKVPYYNATTDRGYIEAITLLSVNQTYLGQRGHHPSSNTLN